MDCTWVNLKNVGPPFFKFISLYRITTTVVYHRGLYDITLVRVN